MCGRGRRGVCGPLVAAVCAVGLGCVAPLLVGGSVSAQQGSGQVSAGGVFALRTCLGLPATIVGTGRADTLVGTPARDVIVGLGGPDLVRGRAANDRVCAGRGADTVVGGRNSDRVEGGRGRDVLRGGRHDDRLDGGAGIDRLFAGRSRGESDLLSGGRGDDRLLAGRHHSFGCAAYSQFPGPIVADLRVGTVTGSGAGTDTLIGIRCVYGTAADDVLTGGPRRDRLYGEGGEDVITGRGGWDSISGGNGADVIRLGREETPGFFEASFAQGGGGNDDIVGTFGRDSIAGGDGRDRLEGKAGNDHLYAGGLDPSDPGHDSVHNDVFGGAGSDTLSGQLRRRPPRRRWWRRHRRRRWPRHG